MLSYTPLVIFKGESTVGTSVERQKGGMHVAGPHGYLEKVMQLCFTGRTKTTYHQTCSGCLLAMSEKFQTGGFQLTFPCGVMDSLDSPRNKVDNTYAFLLTREVHLSLEARDFIGVWSYRHGWLVMQLTSVSTCSGSLADTRWPRVRHHKPHG